MFKRRRSAEVATLLADLAEWWKEGDSPLHAGALLGESDLTIRERVLALAWRVPPVNQTIRHAKAEIISDAKNGTVPATVSSFAELHDHVDANGYGGAFDWPIVSDTKMLADEHTAYWNTVQDALDAWIRRGGLRKATR